MQHLLSSIDLSKTSIEKIFSLAKRISAGDMPVFEDHPIMVLLFDEPSTRTRISLEVGMAQMGGSSIYVDTRTSQLSRGETLQDTARVISSYADIIAVRTREQDDVMAMSEGSSVPIINALTHLEHPTQALADVYTIMEQKGRMKGLRIAFVGDIAQNTANSLMVTAAKMGASTSLVGPKGFEPNPRYLKEARKYGKVDIYNSMAQGLAGADIVYTDTFVSMGDEAGKLKRQKLFAPYQLNKKALSYAKRDALVMHPLPAHRGMEITADVLEGKQSIVWQQAGNKLVIGKAVVLYLSGQ
ncbi:MAG TPA: ornithine carbamoyltransferase [Candidatus Acidoferrales bacterium]|nr:ornithine carbamoyltransferase [Candidatus Acidoferrales bacterium]